MSERFSISTDGQLRPSPEGSYRLNSDYEKLERGLQKIITRYDGFTSAKEMMQIARETLAPHSCPNCSKADAAIESAIRVHGALSESQEKQLECAHGG